MAAEVSHATADIWDSQTGSEIASVPTSRARRPNSHGGKTLRRNALPALFAALVIAHGSAEAADCSGRARMIDSDTIAAIDACERDQTGSKDGKVGAVTSQPAAIWGRWSTSACSLQHHRSGSVSPPGGRCFIGDVDSGLAMVKAGPVTQARALTPSVGLALRNSSIIQATSRSPAPVLGAGTLRRDR
ncbi:hypothetical protein ACVII0_005158 [Sinorhizobium meliloti]